MLEEAEHGSKYMCMRVHILTGTCAHSCTHAHTHRNVYIESESYHQRGAFYFQRRKLLQKSPILGASVTQQVSDFYICTQPPAEVLSPACQQTRKQHTIRLLSGVPVSLWDRAVEWFFICSFFMLHWPINAPFLQF